MASLLTGFFSVEKLLPAAQAKGPVPNTRQTYKNVIDIALPSVMEMVLMSLVGSVDTMMVSLLGDEAIAAVGLVGQPRMLLLSLFYALNIGVTAIVARRKGENRPEEANRTMRNALTLVVILSVLLVIPALSFAGQLMQLAGAKEDTIADSTVYFKILAMFLPVNALTMCICAAQRGVGNTRLTMKVNITSNLVNVVFNYLLIGGNLGFPRLEVAGAAIATVLGMIVGLALSLFTIFDTRRNHGFLRIHLRDDWRPDWEALRGIVKLGGNAMLEQAALRVGFFAYARIVAELGTQAFAAHQIAAQFQNLSFTFGDGIGVAGTSLVGQMLGKNRPDLAKLYGKASQRMALVVALILATLIVVFRYPLVGLFTQSATTDPKVKFLAAQVMLMVAAFQPLQTSSVVISGALRGAGDTRYVAAVMMLCVALIRPLVSLLAIYVLNDVMHLSDLALMGAWAASIIDMGIRLFCVYRRFNGGKWYDIKV